MKCSVVQARNFRFRLQFDERDRERRPLLFEPRVARQDLGCQGKVDRGPVTVHLGVCRGAFKTPLDAASYLPKEWDADRKRCRAAGIPDAVVYRPKWRIAPEQLDRARNGGVAPDGLTFDEGYGACPGFVAGPDERRRRFVGEVPRSFSCPAVHRAGRRPTAEVQGRAAEDVVRGCVAFRSQPWRVPRLGRQTLEDRVGRVKAARVWPHGADGRSADSYGPIRAGNDATGEEKFFPSNAAADARVEAPVGVGFRRRNVEHCFRTAKSGLGFTHFAGRRYEASMRHLSPCLVTLAFVAEHTERLRGKNPEPTMGQVCRALGEVCRDWPRRRRGTTDRESTLGIIGYHRARNAAARAAKKKKTPVVRNRKKPRRRRRKRKSRCTVRSR